MVKPREKRRPMERRYAKRNTRSIYKYMDETMANLLELAEIFEKQHPPEAQMLRVIAKVILHAQQLLSRWYEHVWGRVPKGWYTVEEEG